MVKGVVQKEVCVQWHRLVSRFEMPNFSGKHKKFTRQAPADFELLINLVCAKIVKREISL